jgi:UDP-glucose 4-epimerase
VRRLVYAASSSCYGIPDAYPTPETAAIRPQYLYALTKYLGEELVRHWADTYNLPAVSLRLFNVYGPRARMSGTYGAVFGVFLAQKLARRPFAVVGNGTQTRGFTFVADVVEAFLAAGGEVSGEIFNVGSGNTYSVNRLVELLGGDVVYMPRRPGEPDCTFADTAKIRRVLGWRPKVSFEDGVRVMLSCIEDWREAPVWDPASIADATLECSRIWGRLRGDEDFGAEGPGGRARSHAGGGQEDRPLPRGLRHPPRRPHPTLRGSPDHGRCPGGQPHAGQVRE